MLNENLFFLSIAIWATIAYFTEKLHFWKHIIKHVYIKSFHISTTAARSNFNIKQETDDLRKSQDQI